MIAKESKTQEQIDAWASQYGREVSADEYKAICDNVSGFFSVLKNWHDKEKSCNSKAADKHNFNF